LNLTNELEPYAAIADWVSTQRPTHACESRAIDVDVDGVDHAREIREWRRPVTHARTVANEASRRVAIAIRARARDSCASDE